MGWRNFMNNTPSTDPAKRQVFVNLSNRFVVFDPDGGLPKQLRFDPEDSAILPRVADESEVAEARIEETSIFVDIKVRERDPRRRDFQSGTERLKLAKSKGQDQEVW